MPKRMIFGIGEFSDCLAYFLKPDGRTVHRAYMSPDSGAIPFEDLERCDLYLAIGPGEVNRNRERIYEEALWKHRISSWVHSSAVVNGSFGNGCIIFEGNNIQPYSVIGHNTVCWSQNHIGHHSIIGDHCFITSHCVISGGVTIGSRCFLGVNCSITDHVTIGEGSIVAAGAVVDRDMPPDSVWGRDGLSKVPAHRVKL